MNFFRYLLWIFWCIICICVLFILFSPFQDFWQEDTCLSSVSCMWVGGFFLHLQRNLLYPQNLLYFQRCPWLKKNLLCLFSISPHCTPKYTCTPQYTAPPKPLHRTPIKSRFPLFARTAPPFWNLWPSLPQSILLPFSPTAAYSFFSPSPPLQCTHSSPLLPHYSALILPLLPQTILPTPSFSPFLLHTQFFSPPSATIFHPFPRLLNFCR